MGEDRAKEAGAGTGQAASGGEKVLARMTPSAPRRVAGVALLGGLGLFLLALGVGPASGALGLVLALLALGGLCLWLSWRLWEATALGLELTRDVLRDTRGRVLTPVAEIASIERGALALKPAGGFTLITRAAGPRAWAPGLWWRAGRRIGVGGVTHRNEGRFMAETLAGLLEKP